ncbi:hypothetical protein [Streptomyces cinerochromogenes]|uniref:hypothetical protein n=1 Tax=Streptomyces cinerochromogenes TaxID=66422 RepID=UPI0033B64484
MTDQLPISGRVTRPWCVPISKPFAAGCVGVLQAFRERTAKALEVPDGKLDRTGPFFREVDTLAAMPAGDERGARQALHSMLLDAGGLVWMQGVDHIRALEHDIVMDPPPVWSPLTLGRVTLECCAFTGYLFDPAIPLGRRLARSVGLRVTEARNEGGAAANFGPVEQTMARAGLTEAETMAADAGAAPRRDRRNKIIGYSIDGEYAPLDHKIAPQIKDFLPDWAMGSYQLMSGAAHGRPWMIARGRSAGEEWVGEAATVLAAVMTVMAALESGLAAYAGYFGHDVSEALEAMKGERMDFLSGAYELAHESI